MQTRNRAFSLTFNNEIEENLLRFELYCTPDKVTYAIYGGIEFAPDTGHRHVHGYIYHKNAIRISSLRRAFQGAHIEVAKGTAEQNERYCCKEHPAQFVFGVQPRQGRRTDYERIRSELRAGRRTGHVLEECTSYPAIRYAQTYATILQLRPRKFKPVVYWFFGPTGTGKTRRVYEMAGEDLWSSCLGDAGWFDGYSGQESALFDDFRPTQYKFSHFLRLLDRYPLRVPIKGGFSEWRPTTIFVTCPNSPEYTYNVPEESIAQLLRRIDVIEQFF